MRGIENDGGLEEGTAQVRGDGRRRRCEPLANGILEMPLDSRHGSQVDERSLIRFAAQSIADPQPSTPLRQAFARRRRRRGRAPEIGWRRRTSVRCCGYLLAIAPDHRRIEIGVLEDHERRVSTELQRELLQRARGLCMPAACRSPWSR